MFIIGLALPALAICMVWCLHKTPADFQNADMKDLWIIFIPFLGTALGAACVYVMKDKISPTTERALSGFAAGVMVAASVWSLLIPSMEQSQDMGRWSSVPAVAGFWAGILFLLLLDKTVPHLHNHGTEAEGPRSRLKRTTKLILAVTLHNIPEGMAVGVTYAGWINGNTSMTMAGALALAVGIAIQNFPEGAIVSIPLRTGGVSRSRSFLYGLLSGAVEPAAAVLTVLLAAHLVPLMPYLLSFAAGAMIYVVVEELIPEMSSGRHSNTGTLMFAAGFALMMILDTALG